MLARLPSVTVCHSDAAYTRSMTRCLMPSLLLALASLARGEAPQDPMPNPLAAVVLERIGQSEAPACIVVGFVSESTSITYGCGRDAGPARLDRDSLFEIGSITKGFTGLLLADMVLRGEVSLDDEAAMYSRQDARLPTFEG